MKKNTIMVGTGFILIAYNAMGYMLKWENQSPVLFILGLIFVAVGLNRGKK